MELYEHIFVWVTDSQQPQTLPTFPSHPPTYTGTICPHLQCLKSWGNTSWTWQTTTASMASESLTCAPHLQNLTLWIAEDGPNQYTTNGCRYVFIINIPNHYGALHLVTTSRWQLPNRLDAEFFLKEGSLSVLWYFDWLFSQSSHRPMNWTDLALVMGHLEGRIGWHFALKRKVSPKRNSPLHGVGLLRN